MQYIIDFYQSNFYFRLIILCSLPIIIFVILYKNNKKNIDSSYTEEEAFVDAAFLCPFVTILVGFIIALILVIFGLI